MRWACCLLAATLSAPPLLAQALTPPRLVKAELGSPPFHVQSGGIAACDVAIDDKGAVTSVDLVQDVAPYGGMLKDALPAWGFEPAREGGTAVASRVLVLGFFRPPELTIPAPTNPRYKDTTAPPELPWPTAVVAPPYPPNALGSGMVVLEGDISGSGEVIGTRVLTQRSAFDAAAADTLRQWKFRPAERGNRDAPSRAFFVFSFIGTTP